MADLRPAGSQRSHILHVELRKPSGNPVHETMMRQKIAKSQGSGGKSAWHPDTRICQLADHFAKGCILPAYRIHVGHTQLFKGNDEAITVRAHGLDLVERVGGKNLGDDKYESTGSLEVGTMTEAERCAKFYAAALYRRALPCVAGRCRP